MRSELKANQALADYNEKEYTMRQQWENWHGYSSDSFFSGMLVRYASDNESVIVGRYYS